jgi:glycosyltransferase involved in cell wall biosynthesis
MNILFLIGTYPSYGGTEKVTTVLANCFCQQGYKIHIASFSQPIPELAAELDPSIQLHKLSYPVNSKSNQKILRNIILQNKIDIIINQWCLPYYVTLLCNKARRGTSCKLIAVHHNSPDSNARIEQIKIYLCMTDNVIKRMFFQLVLHLVKKATSLSLYYVYKGSDRYVVLSDSFVKIWGKTTRIKNLSKIATIANPLTLCENNVQYIPEKKLQEVIYVGRLDYNQKKVYRIIQLWQCIEKKYTDWHLTIVGDGPQREDIDELIKELKLERVLITGFKNPIEYYKNASLLLLTSEYEGFGLVIVEGMNFGVVPIVYGSYSAIYDIIKHGENGFITNLPYSQEEMLYYVEILMENENLRKKMSLNAVDATKKFSLDAIIMQWKNLFKTL